MQPIPKGELGKSSKIAEELAELHDAELQGNKILIFCELADLYGALNALAITYGLCMDDLRDMAAATARAFADGER